MRTNSDSRILILGNGPSLKKEYFPSFKNLPCLGMNAAYRYWQRIGWYPEVYCCLDDQVVLSHADAIAGMIEGSLCKHFLLHPNFLERYPTFANASGVYYLPQLMKGQKNADLCLRYGLDHIPQDQFLSTMPSKLTTGSYALRFASFLGYRHLGLVGIDARYTEIINEAKTLEGIVLEIDKSPKNNPNYFFDDYQIAGDRYNIPNPTVHQGNLHLQAFKVLRDDIVKYNFDVEVQVCTPESELYEETVFPYLPLEDFITGPRLSAVFVPFVKHDVDLLVRNLTRWGCQEFAPYRVAPAKPNVELHLAFNGSPDISLEECLARAFASAGLSNFFASLHFHYSRLEGLRDLYTRKFEGPVGPEGYMSGPNNQFFDIIRKFSVGMSHVVLMEPDVIPIRANWLSKIEDIVAGPDRFWICGSHYRGVAKVQSFSHINGNAIYNVGDPDFRKFFHQEFLPHFYTRVKAVPSLCYDIVLHDMFHKVFANRADERAFGRWANVVHRFRFSEFLVDVSHPSDRATDALLTLAQARRTYPDAYLYHGAIAKIEADVLVGARKSLRATLMPHSTVSPCVVMLDPDALDQFGHYLAYDDQLDKVLRSYSGGFTVLANQQLPSAIAGSRRYFMPCFTDHSWTIGIPSGKTQQIAPQALTRFESEVAGFVDECRRSGGAEEIRLYMYCAGLPHAQALVRVMNRLPGITAVVNLFYLPFQAVRSPGFAAQWLPVLKSLLAHPNLVLTVPTDTLASDLQELYGVELTVTPHPSPTVSDTVFSLLQRNAVGMPVHSDKRVNVLFPSAPTVGKGSEFVIGAANYFAARRPDLRVTVRDLRRQSTSAQVAALYDTLDSRVEKLTGLLSNEEFLHVFLSADVVVLPYTPDMFRYRNSGLLVDAIYCGKPVIVVKDTWLGNLVQRTGCGIVINEASADAIDAALTSIITALPQYQDRAKAAARSYFVCNSWNALARLVCNSFDNDTVKADFVSGVKDHAGRATVLPIDRAGRSESLSSIRARLGTGSFNLRSANLLFREGDYPGALGIYQWLYQQQPLKIYGDNAVMAAQKLGMDWVSKLDDLPCIN